MSRIGQMLIKQCNNPIYRANPNECRLDLIVISCVNCVYSKGYDWAIFSFLRKKTVFSTLTNIQLFISQDIIINKCV